MAVIIIKRNGIEHEAEIVHNEGETVEICYEHNGAEYYGRTLRSALRIHGPRHEPFYTLDNAAVEWDVTKDLDNLETWE